MPFIGLCALRHLVDTRHVCVPSECLAARTTAARGGHSAVLLQLLGCQAAMAWLVSLSTGQHVDGSRGQHAVGCLYNRLFPA